MIKKKGQRKHTARLVLNDYSIPEVVESLDGEKIVKIRAREFQLEYGFINEKGNFKKALILPKTFTPDWLSELKFDGHFCFVDTNEVKSAFPGYERFTHATGLYIFKIMNLQSRVEGSETIINFDTDFENSIVQCFLFQNLSGCPERKGWDLAISELCNLKARKAKIYVDKYQNDLSELSKELPEGYNFYYTSSDRQHTPFHEIFRRLDSLINQLVKNGFEFYTKKDIVEFLTGHTNHLVKTRKP